MDSKIDLSIIIVAWNVKDLVDECLKTLQESEDHLHKEILFVDNGSRDGTAQMVRERYPEVVVIEIPDNVGFIRANNLAYRQAQGKYVLMLNSDAFVGKYALRDTVEFMEKTPDCGVVGAKLIGRDGVLQPSARNFPTPFRLFLQRVGVLEKLPFLRPLDDLERDHSCIRECDWVVGCYLLVRKDIVDDMGFFLREDYFLYNDDNDLCLRVKKKGWKVYFYPTDVVHIGGETVKRAEKNEDVDQSGQAERYQIESQFIYFRKNYHLGAVISNYLCLIAFDVLRVLGLFRRHRKESFLDVLKHMRFVTGIFCKTRCGARAIH